MCIRKILNNKKIYNFYEKSSMPLGIACVVAGISLVVPGINQPYEWICKFVIITVGILFVVVSFRFKNINTKINEEKRKLYK